MATFEDITDTFWDTASHYLVQPPLDDAALAAAEETLGVRLPAEYVALLRVQNGGVVADAFTAHPMTERTSWAADHVALDEMRGIGPGTQTILASPYLTDEWEMPAELVLLTGDGHWWIALDYRTRGRDGEPSVVWYDNELGEDVQVAATFRAFAEGLVPGERFTGPAPDMDRPPGAGYVHDGALSGVILILGEDIKLLKDGGRSLENTKLVCRARASGALKHLPWWKTRRLAASLKAVDAAATEDELVMRLSDVFPELERLMPAWIRRRRPGWALDEKHLRERAASRE